MNFRDRLYRSYSSGHIQLTPERLPAILPQGEPYLRRVLKRWVPPTRSIRILDLGCGFGALLHLLRKLGYSNLSGVDVSSEQVKLAHTLGLDFVVCGEIRDTLLQMGDGSVDLVFAFDVLEHLTRPELLEMGDLVHRVLAPGGKLIVHVPNASGIFSGVIRYGDLTHEIAFTPQSLSQFGNACGLKVVAIAEDDPVPHGMVSALRWLIWKVGTLPLRFLYLSEYPQKLADVILSQNMLCVFSKVDHPNSFQP